MVNGQVLLHSFTIVDGWRVQDMLVALRRNPDVTATLAGRRPASHGESSALRARSGRAIPAGDLSLHRRHHRCRTAARSARRLGASELAAAWADRDPDLPLQNADELLIMASIVQKESGLPQELAKIAGLYLHRLSIGMRLQADPTVIYGLGDRYDGDIKTVDLRTDGPYNTYTRAGLPPTPIALAGAAAIRATAHPEKTDAIYFVASPKGDGSHVFSATCRSTTRPWRPTWRISAARRRRIGRNERDARGRFLTIEGIEGVGKSDPGGAALQALARARHRCTW